MRFAAALAALCLAGPVTAQPVLDLPDTVASNSYTDNLPNGQARLLAFGVDDAFLEALTGYDPADIYRVVDLEGPILDAADFYLVVAETWADVAETWIDLGMEPINQYLPLDLMSQLEHSDRTVFMTLSDGRRVRFSSFLSNFDGTQITAECMAAQISDEMYRGTTNADIDAVACSAGAN